MNGELEVVGRLMRLFEQATIIWEVGEGYAIPRQ